MSDASKRGKNNRRRGQSGERELCGILTDELGTVVKRRLGQERDQGTDIHVGPFRIEVKRRKRIAGLYEWLQQADAVSGEVGTSGVPIVALRADGEGWLAVMRLEDWLTFARGEL